MSELSSDRARELSEVLRAACSLAGVIVRGEPQLIKYTNNAVYHLPGTDMVARIGIGALGVARAHRLVPAARWLHAQDAPTVRLAEIEQPVVIDTDYAVTFWTELDRTPPPHGWTGADLAVPLRRLHRLCPRDAPLPDWDPFAAARSRLAAADGIDPDDLAWLHQQWDRAREQYAELALPATVVHGDAHTGNLLRSGGRAVLADLDSTGIGPAAWDLTVAAVGAIRFGKPQVHRELARAYGVDVTRTPQWPVLRRIRELVLVTSAVPDLRRRASIATEHRHRLRTLRRHDTDARWNLYR